MEEINFYPLTNDIKKKINYVKTFGNGWEEDFADNIIKQFKISGKQYKVLENIENNIKNNHKNLYSYDGPDWDDVYCDSCVGDYGEIW